MDAPLWPLLAYAGGAFAFVAGIILVSHFVGERHDEPATHKPYESGVVPTFGARSKLSVHFYLIAVFFVIFDVEAAFLLAWAVSARETGWLGFTEVALFIAVLLVALGYLGRVGALDWGPVPRRSTSRGSK